MQPCLLNSAFLKILKKDTSSGSFSVDVFERVHVCVCTRVKI